MYNELTDLNGFVANEHSSYHVNVNGDITHDAAFSGGDDNIHAKSLTDSHLELGNGHNILDLAGSSTNSIITGGNDADLVTIHGTVDGGGINLGGGDDQLILSGFTSGHLNGGDGNDSLILKLDGNSQGFSSDHGVFSGLFDGSNSAESFETLRLDLSGGAADTLNLTDDMLSNLKNVHNNSDMGGDLKVFVNGDSGHGVNDHVDMTGFNANHDWTAGEQQTVNGVDYTVWHNTAENLQLLIQANLLS